MVNTAVFIYFLNHINRLILDVIIFDYACIIIDVACINNERSMVQSVVFDRHHGTECSGTFHCISAFFFFLPPAHMSKVFVSKGSPVTPEMNPKSV